MSRWTVPVHYFNLTRWVAPPVYKFQGWSQVCIGGGDYADIVFTIDSEGDKVYGEGNIDALLLGLDIRPVRRIPKGTRYDRSPSSFPSRALLHVGRMGLRLFGRIWAACIDSYLMEDSRGIGGRPGGDQLAEFHRIELAFRMIGGEQEKRPLSAFVDVLRINK